MAAHKRKYKDTPTKIDRLIQNGSISRTHYDVLREHDDEIVKIYTLFAGESPQERVVAAGGRNVLLGGQLFMARVVANFDRLRLPTQPVIDPAFAGRPGPGTSSVPAPYFIGLNADYTMKAVVGTLRYETGDYGQQHFHYLGMQISDGSGYAPARHLIAFQCGFHQSGTDEGKFFLMVWAYPKEIHHANQSELSDIVATQNRTTFTSEDRILDATDLAKYASGTGMRLKFDVTLYG